MELQYVTGNIRKFLVKIITNVVEMTALSLVLLSQLFKRVRMKRNFLDEIKYLVHRDKEGALAAAASLRFCSDWIAGSDTDSCSSPGLSSSRRPDSVLDFCCHGHEGLLHVSCVLSRGL